MWRPAATLRVEMQPNVALSDAPRTLCRLRTQRQVAAFNDALCSSGIVQYVGSIQRGYNVENEVGEDAAACKQGEKPPWQLW